MNGEAPFVGSDAFLAARGGGVNAVKTAARFLAQPSLMLNFAVSREPATCDARHSARACDRRC
jgi:hypothetical protein